MSRPAQRLAAALCTLLTLAAAQARAGNANANSSVSPPNSNPYGQSYADWSGAHWQWLYSLPTSGHPLFDTADVSTGQSGQVWFLGGTFTTTMNGIDIVAQVTRDVTIPSGKALFFPLIDAESSILEGNGPTAQDLIDATEFFIDAVDPASVFLVIDGKPVTGLADYRFSTFLFFGPLPLDNVLGVPGFAGMTTLSYSDGYFAMVKPLSVGKHTLHFGGTIDLAPAFVFVQDITYNITVVPAGQYKK
jgi:hypothetical protein